MGDGVQGGRYGGLVGEICAGCGGGGPDGGVRVMKKSRPYGAGISRRIVWLRAALSGTANKAVLWVDSLTVGLLRAGGWGAVRWVCLGGSG